jgi:uncharacterized membrane protein
VNVETAISGLIFGLVIWLVAWRLGVRPSPWRDAIAGTLIYVAISLPLLAAGVGTESITIAVIGSALLIGAWKRFAHRPI